MTARDDIERLSPEGRLRRDAMLLDMQRLVDATRARRRQRRMAASGTAIVLAAFMAFQAVRLSEPEHAAGPAGSRRGVAPGEIAVRVERVVDGPLRLTRMVDDDESAGHRLRGAPPRRVIWLDDDSLLAELAAVNRPAGLLTLAGHTRLTAAVTNDALGLRP